MIFFLPFFGHSLLVILPVKVNYTVLLSKIQCALVTSYFSLIVCEYCQILLVNMFPLLVEVVNLTRMYNKCMDVLVN